LIFRGNLAELKKFYNVNCWKSNTSLVKAIVKDLAPPALAMLAFCILVDSWFYGKMTIVPWNFAKFNLLMDVSSQVSMLRTFFFLADVLDK
jgi:hypothetical protein